MFGLQSTLPFTVVVLESLIFIINGDTYCSGHVMLSLHFLVLFSDNRLKEVILRFGNKTTQTPLLAPKYSSTAWI